LHYAYFFLASISIKYKFKYLFVLETPFGVAGCIVREHISATLKGTKSNKRGATPWRWRFMTVAGWTTEWENRTVQGVATIVVIGCLTLHPLYLLSHFERSDKDSCLLYLVATDKAR
jgi:hypothetical protein